MGNAKQQKRDEFFGGAPTFKHIEMAVNGILAELRRGGGSLITMQNDLTRAMNADALTLSVEDRMYHNTHIATAICNLSYQGWSVCAMRELLKKYDDLISDIRKSIQGS